MSPQPMVRMQGLTRRFGAVTAVDDVSLTVERGELFGLVGPDGAGKTTLLRMLAGVLRPSSGDAFITGISIAHDPEAVKHELAYMSQRFGLYTDLTVAENLDFYADLYDVPSAERAVRVERLYRFSNLGPFRDRLAGKLSGGMKQKLGLSCALIHQPTLLLLDEPTFGVDPISRRDLWLIVHEMVAEGVTVIASTAYMDEAERFDRVALLHGGRIVAMDAPAALEVEVGGEMVALELEASRVRAAREIVAGQPETRHVHVFGERLHVLVADARMDGESLRRALESRGIAVRSLKAIPPSLEDVFIGRMTEERSA